MGRTWQNFAISLLAVAALLPAALRPTALADEPREPQSAAQTKSAPAAGAALEWTPGLEAGKRRAKLDGRPLLVRVGADWCSWCDKLGEEIAKSSVQAELRRWALAYVDADADEADAQQLGASALPALRVLDAGGKLIGKHDGYLDEEAPIDWCKRHYQLATAAPPDVLTAEDPPDESTLRELVTLLPATDPREREAAIRRLAHHRDLAATPVVDVFAHGKLAARLAALEILTQWQAPLAEIDPWRPESFTAERMQALRDWAKVHAATATDKATEFTPEELVEVQREIDRLSEASEAQADATNERLARFGAAILPSVVARLQEATDDVTHTRLLALRYRLVASPATALKWRGGLARLASPEVVMRQKAASELADRATVADAPLLLELFADPDPLVREISLHGLQHTGGEAAAQALLKLLDDPDPNVRAAVLKQLTEEPADHMAGRLAEFAMREKNADLIVHAVRALKAAKAVRQLIDLPRHDDWQVRAEITESLAGLVSEHPNENVQADIYVALIDRLTDADAFVVSRAIRGLSGARLTAAVEPLIKAAEEHPDLAGEVIESLGRSPALHGKAAPLLRRFLTDEDSAVRARVLTALVAAGVDDLDELIVQGMRDSVAAVRESAANEMFRLFGVALARAQSPEIYANSIDEDSATIREFFTARKGEAAGTNKSQPSAATDAEPKADEQKPADEENRDGEKHSVDEDDTSDEWLLAFRQPNTRPQWMNGTIEPLGKMIADGTPREQAAAALALAPLGDELALVTLRSLVRGKAIQAQQASAVLPWLLWKDRLEFLSELLALDPSATPHEIAANFAMNKTSLAIEPLWGLLVRKGADVQLAQATYNGLLALYQRQVAERGDDGSAKATKEVIRQASDYAQKGSPWQRIIAIVVLFTYSQEDAANAAEQMASDQELSAEFRADAIQLLLAAEDEQKATKLAVAQLGSADAALRKMALRYLAQGPNALRLLRGTIYLNRGTTVSFNRAGEAVSVEAPAGLKAEMVQPFLVDSDPEVAASAGYLLATLGDASGLLVLADVWRKQPGHSPWTASLYRAIVALDDDEKTPLLAEIYKQIDAWERRDFYWTIRSMHGDNVMKLRKQIRDEVGMDQLR